MDLDGSSLDLADLSMDPDGSSVHPTGSTLDPDGSSVDPEIGYILAGCGTRGPLCPWVAFQKLHLLFLESVSRRLPFASDSRGQSVSLSVEGKPCRAYAGESVAAALYASGKQVLLRSLKYHRPRSFFCLDGHCGGCLMRIDGVPNIRACMEPCRPGMSVVGQNSYPAPDFDVLEAVDWMFPRGMNHHTLMTGSSVLSAVTNKLVRQLSGLGQLPDRQPARSTDQPSEQVSGLRPDRIPPATREAPDVLVIGAGPAGLAAATQAARMGARTVLIDEQTRAGGSLLWDPRHGPERADARTQDAARAGVDIRLSSTAVGYYGDEHQPVLAVAGRDAMTLMAPRKYIYATGSYAVNRLFANNDRPGVVAARAAGRLLLMHGIQPGQRVCLVSDGHPASPEDDAGSRAGSDTFADALAAAMIAAGCDVIRVVEPSTRVLGVRGRSWINAVDIEVVRSSDEPPETQRVECDLVAVCATPAPASETPRQHGCEVEFVPRSGGFIIKTDESGHTNVADVLACGDVCGYVGPVRAAQIGERVGRQAVASITEERARADEAADAPAMDASAR